MATLPLLLISLSLSAVLLHFATAATGGGHIPQDLVHSSCLNASYPKICLRTLSAYAPPATTPRDLAQAAVKVSLKRAKKASAFLSDLTTIGTNNKRGQSALSDCLDQLSDSVDELSKTLSELKHLRRGTEFRWQMSNAETWVSAALTDEDTCIDGFQEMEIELKCDVKKKITNLGRVTSNALYLINLLDNKSRRNYVGLPE